MTAWIDHTSRPPSNAPTMSSATDGWRAFTIFVASAQLARCAAGCVRFLRATRPRPPSHSGNLARSFAPQLGRMDRILHKHRYTPTVVGCCEFVRLQRVDGVQEEIGSGCSAEGQEEPRRLGVRDGGNTTASVKTSVAARSNLVQSGG